MIKNKSKIYLLKQGSKITHNDPEQSTTTDKDQEKPTTTHNNPNQSRTTQEIIKNNPQNILQNAKLNDPEYSTTPPTTTRYCKFVL